MDANERLEDAAIERQLQLLRAEAGIRRSVIALLKEMEAELSQKLATRDLTSISRQRLTDLLADARSTIASYYVSMRDEVDLKEVAAIEAIGVSQTMQSVVTVKLTTGLSDAKLRALVTDLLIDGAPSAQWWARQGQDTAFRFSNAVRMGVAQGETTAEIVRRIRVGRGEPGIFEVSRRNAESLVLTSIQAATAAADMAVYEDSDVVRGYRQISTLDGRTTNICKAYSGAEWNLKKEPINGNKLPFVNPGGGPNGVPRHFRCRSRIVPLLRPLDVLPEFRPSTRASADGPVASTTTFDDWLEKKPKAFQEETLGKGKAQLYRDGKISLQQLLDQSGRPLTLAELRKKYE